MVRRNMKKLLRELRQTVKGAKHSDSKCKDTVTANVNRCLQAIAQNANEIERKCKQVHIGKKQYAQSGSGSERIQNRV